MNDETKEKRCKFCGKLLISEKMPICRRCKLEGRNKVGQVGALAASAVTFFYKVKNALSEKKIDNKARFLDEKVCGRY